MNNILWLLTSSLFPINNTDMNRSSYEPTLESPGAVSQNKIDIPTSHGL